MISSFISDAHKDNFPFAARHRAHEGWSTKFLLSSIRPCQEGKAQATKQLLTLLPDAACCVCVCVCVCVARRVCSLLTTSKNIKTLIMDSLLCTTKRVHVFSLMHLLFVCSLLSLLCF
jgi:hypothetical protein